MQRKKSDIVTPLSQTIKPLGPGEQKKLVGFIFLLFAS